MFALVSAFLITVSPMNNFAGYPVITDTLDQCHNYMQKATDEAVQRGATFTTRLDLVGDKVAIIDTGLGAKITLTCKPTFSGV